MPLNAMSRWRLSGTLAGILVVGLVGVCKAEPTADASIASFGTELAAALNKVDMDALEKMIDLQALATRVARKMAISERETSGFVAGFSKKGSINSLLANTLESLRRAHGKVELMRVVQRGEERRPLLRYDLGDNGFDYHEYILESTASGYRIVDWYQLSTGELTSATIAVASKLLMDPNPGFLKSLLGVSAVNDDLVVRFKSIGQLEREHKFVDAIGVIEKMPPELANSRVLMVKAASLASASGDDSRYRRALSNLAERHGDDPTLAFMLLDHYFYEGNVDKALQSIAAMEARLGRDGVTELLKANIHYSKHHYDEMVSHAQQAILLEPNRPNAYFVLALGYISKEQYPMAIETYSTLGSKLGYRFTRAGFESDPKMKKFVQSAAFKSWPAVK